MNRSRFVLGLFLVRCDWLDMVSLGLKRPSAAFEMLLSLLFERPVFWKTK